MSLTEREKSTKERYDVQAEDWLEYSGGRNRPSFWKEELDTFRNLLTKNDKIVEVGCGPATDGKYLETIGLQPVSFDYSFSMLKIAKEIRSNSNLIQADTYSMSFADNSFDGFCAIATLLHLENLEKALKELVRVTKNGGIGFITIKEGEGDIVDPKTGYYFKYYKHFDFYRLLEKQGLRTFETSSKKGTPNHDWLTYLVQVVK